MSKVNTEADLGALRAQIDQKSLNEYLVKSDPQSFVAPFTYKQFGFGQSNPSYQIIDGKGRKYVLRKQPPGTLLNKTAHRVDREFYMIKALYETGEIPVPKVLLLCQDRAILGSDFYIMEFCAGRIFHDPSLPGLDPKDRRELWTAAIETLVKLHKLDPTKIGLNPMFLKGQLGSHYPRQLKTLQAVSDSQAQAVDPKSGKKLGGIPDSDLIISFLANNLPSLSKPRIVHGDYKIDNLIYHPTENRVIAILDWELCTLGHPLADISNLLQPFCIPRNHMTEAMVGNAIGPLEGAEKDFPGLYNVSEVLKLYSDLGGSDYTAEFPFSIVFAALRTVVICHGVAARLLLGQAVSQEAAEIAKGVPVFSYLAIREIAKSRVGKVKL